MCIRNYIISMRKKASNVTKFKFPAFFASWVSKNKIYTNIVYKSEQTEESA